MNIDQSIVDLICDIEYTIGYECYNPNSYNGWTRSQGCGYRYPVHFRRNNEDHTITVKDNVKYYIGSCPDDIRTMKYKFGSNHLFIGEGIINVLNMLENRYNIDFNKLEEEYREKENSRG